MKVRVLGTRGEIKQSDPEHSKHSGVLVDGTLLFDVGEKEFLDYRPQVLFITHLHPDHAFFIKDKAKSKIEVPIFGPEAYEDSVKVQPILSEVTIGSYKITPVPTHHGKRLMSCAYILEKGDQKLAYTGDVVWIDKKYHHLFRGASLVITDGSLIRKGGRVFRDKESGRIYGHTGIPDLVSLFKNYTEDILFVHFGSWFYEDVKKSKEALKALGKENGVRVTAAYDGMELNLEDLPSRLQRTL